MGRSITSLGFACLPYISGLTEPLTRLLRKNDIRVVSKPAKTLQQEFPSPKFRQPLDLICNVVYKIPCSDCRWSYVGETGRCLKTRLPLGSRFVPLRGNRKDCYAGYRFGNYGRNNLNFKRHYEYRKPPFQRSQSPTRPSPKSSSTTTKQQ